MKGEKSLCLSRRWIYQSSLTDTWTKDKHKNARTSNTDKRSVCSLNVFHISALSLRRCQHFCTQFQFFFLYQNAFLHCNTVFMPTALQYIKSYYYNLWKMSWKNSFFLFSSFRFCSEIWAAQAFVRSFTKHPFSVGLILRDQMQSKTAFHARECKSKQKNAGASRQRTT